MEHHWTRDLLLDALGGIYKDYCFMCSLGTVNCFDLANAESIKPLSYVECSRQRFMPQH